MRLGLAAVGFTATIAQIVLMRELVATFYGNELLFGLVLFSWLAWVAAGAWGLARLADRRRLGANFFAAGLVISAVLFPLEIALVRGIRNLLDVTPGAFVEFGPMVVAVILVLAPLCLVGGFLFTLGARLVVEGGGSPGQAYVWEGIGAVAGGALLSFVLIETLDPFQITFLVGAVSLSIAADLWYRRFWPSLLVFGLFVIVALTLGPLLHDLTLRWQWENLAYSGDSRYGRITIQARDSQRVFYENGLLVFETQGTFPEAVAHFPLLIHPDPQRVLLIGGGIAGDLREITKHDVFQVTYVEIDPLLIEAATAELPSEDAAVLEDPRVELIQADGRLFVKQSLAQNIDRYDVVISDLPEPATGGLNRFYTREFFAEVRGLLSNNGIFALGLPSAENYWSPELARRNGSVYQTLRSVFPEVVALPGEHNFFFASESPLDIDPVLLADRMADRGLKTLFVTPEYVKYVFTTDRFVGLQRELEKAAGIRLNEDLKPICYYYDLALWLSQFYPGLRTAFEKASLVNLWWVGLFLAGIVLLARWRRTWAVPITIAAVGLAQMTLQLVILFAFQVLHGYVYAEVSLIVTAFMAGLIIGGTTSNRLVRRKIAPSPSQIKRVLVGVLMAVLVYSALFPLLLTRTIPYPELVFPILAFLAGQLTGMAFPLAVTLSQGSPARVTGRLYGADLVGGCLGALLGAVFFIPLLGIPQTCAVVGLVAIAGLLALI